MKSIPAEARSLTVPVVALFAVFLVGAALSPAGAASGLTAEQEKRMVSIFNRSPAKNLAYLPGMSKEAAGKVVAHRESGHQLTSAEEIRSVAGLTGEQFDALAGRFRGILSDSPAGQAARGEDEAGSKANALQKRMEDRAGGGAARKESAAPAEGSGKLNLEVKAKYYSILPGYDLSKLSDEERHAFLETINKEMCPCGCRGETLGYCLVNDPGCMVVKARVRKIYKDITGEDPEAPAQPSRR